MTVDETNGEEWAIQKLEGFIDDSARVHVPSPPGVISAGSYRTAKVDDEVVRSWAVVEQILVRYLPDWKSRIQEPDGYRHTGYRWREQREGAILCLAQLRAQAELNEHLGSSGPKLPATDMHPWIWDAAKSAWEADNYEDAVDAAARNLNSHTRKKVGRKDIGEGDLIAQLFSDKAADENNPRLRLELPDDLGTSTERNLYGGIIAFGKGLFQAVRNPLAHEAPDAMEMTEQEALECLAALSLLARWIDRAAVIRS
jgi:uncharacterized protein (TIGR02391 family)